MSGRSPAEGLDSCYELVRSTSFGDDALITNGVRRRARFPGPFVLTVRRRRWPEHRPCRGVFTRRDQRAVALYRVTPGEEFAAARGLVPRDSH